MSNLINKTLLNQFRVDSFIASGGMGAVYKVWDLKRNVPLAMKVLHADFMDDLSAFKYFQREARALQKLAHPNIVPFYGLHQTEDFVFMVQQYINGPSLQRILKKNPEGLPLEESLTYVFALCSALGYAHHNNIVHCDIKPGNVMLDRVGNIYLADFGIARHSDSTTTTIAGAGTPAYMAPEQIKSSVVTSATDIYSLGVLFFELLTGRRPFRGDEAATLNKGDTAGERIRYAHLHIPPPDPRSINPSIPPEAAAIILRCLEKSPGKRYTSTSDLLADLHNLGVSFPQRTQTIPVEVDSMPESMTGTSQEKSFARTSMPVQPEKKAAPILLFVSGAAALALMFCVVLGAALYTYSNQTSLPAITNPAVTEPYSNDNAPTATVLPASGDSTVPSTIAATVTVPPPIATEISFSVNQKDDAELVSIPAGSFTMGSATSDPNFPRYEDFYIGKEGMPWNWDTPLHDVYLDEYLIYKTEVTNAMYQKCDSEKKCASPEQLHSRTRSKYYNDPRFADYPVIFVSYADAQSYCSWANAELPTEAQWEKAARGNDLRLFPWGNNPPNGNLVNFGNDTAKVGSFPKGASQYGVLDMAGNVIEWVFDFIDYYPSSPQENPRVSFSSGNKNVVRGGSFQNTDVLGTFRVVGRLSVAPNLTADTRGFRCVVNP